MVHWIYSPEMFCELNLPLSFSGQDYKSLGFIVWTENHEKETFSIQAPWGPADRKVATAKHQYSTWQDTKLASVNRLAKTCHTVTKLWCEISLGFVEHVPFENGVAAAACKRQTIGFWKHLFWFCWKHAWGTSLFQVLNPDLPQAVAPMLVAPAQPQDRLRWFFFCKPGKVDTLQ